jgi:hypothetical protein
MHHQRQVTTLVMALLTVLAAAPSLQAEPILNDEDDAPSSFAELALEAGSRAAILGQCGIGASPVIYAFEHRLESAALSTADKSRLRQSLQSARSSAAGALAASGTSQCSGAYGLLQQTIRDMDRPLS